MLLLVHHSVILEMNLPSYRMEAAKQGKKGKGCELKKIDCRASERVILKGLLIKGSIMCKNGNFQYRWREKIVDVSHPKGEKR